MTIDDKKLNRWIDTAIEVGLCENVQLTEISENLIAIIIGIRGFRTCGNCYIGRHLGPINERDIIGALAGLAEKKHEQLFAWFL